MEIKEYKENNVSFIKLTNKTGLEITLCSFAAGIFDLKIDGKTMLLTSKNVKDYMYNPNYFGKTIGRFAGRIKEGNITIDNKQYHVSKNEPTNALHGGVKSISFKDFNYKIEDSKVIFSLFDKEDELPGDVNFEVTYIISENSNEFEIKYKADTTKDTIINLTNHAYFNLSGDLKETIEDNKFYLACNKYGILSDTLIFLGEAYVDEVTDFRDFHEINKYINDPKIYKDPTRGYDHLFIKENFNDDVVCKMYCPSSKRKLTISSDYKAIVCYSYNYPLDNMVFIPGKVVGARYGFALEPQNLPMSVKKEYFEENILKVGQTYNHYIKYSFTKED